MSDPPTAPKPTHSIEKPDGGRRHNVQVRSYIMEYPTKRMVEAFRLYLCLVDDIYGLDWKKSGGDKLPKEKQPGVRAKMAKDRAAVIRVAIEAMQYMESQAKLQDPKNLGMASHVLNAEIVKEQDMSPGELKTKLEESKKKLESLGKQESGLQTDGE